MQDAFDPYRKWLGIRTVERPLNHYQLLGLEPFEDDSETISHAADQRMTYLRTLAVGDYIEASQKLLNELAAAKVCLLNPDKKAAYDRQLRLPVAAASPPRAVVPPRSTTAQRRPTNSSPPPSTRAPAPAPLAPSRPAADFEPLPLPLMPALPPASGAPARRIRPLPSTTRRPKRGPTSRNSDRPLLPLAAVVVLLVVIVVAAVGVVTAFRNERGAEEVVKSEPDQIDIQPSFQVPLPALTAEPPNPVPQPPENQPPNIEIVGIEPEAPEAGGSLTVLMTGRDPEGDAIAFEYRTGPNAPWQIAPDGRVTLSGLPAGMLSLELRARDSAGHLSDVKTLTKEILAPAPSPPLPRVPATPPSAPVGASDGPPPAVAPFSAERAKQHQEAWANHLKRQIVETNSIGMMLVLIPPGELMMGSPASEIGHRENELQHRVRITKPFYMGVYEVTQTEYQKVLGNNPSWYSSSGKSRQVVRGLDTNEFPVDYVSRDDANEFCRKLSSLTAEQTAGRVYRLPTEAEWEYACRAGTATLFHFGDNVSGQEANCNPYGTNVKGRILRPTTVGSYPPNPFGLRDMHGNVFEWCFDWYGGYSETMGGAVDPAGAETGSSGVFRGGAFSGSTATCRSAYRVACEPTVRSPDIGFRVALVPSSHGSEAASRP